MSDQPGIGGARLDALSRVVAKSAHNLSVADAGTVPAFLDAWMQRLTDYAKHMRLTNGSLSAPVCVIHVEDCGTTGASLGWRRRATLGAAASDRLDGIVAIANDAVGGFVRDPACISAEECEATVAAAGLGNRPAIMLASPKKLVVWPEGLYGEVKPIEHFLDEEAPTLDTSTIDAHLTSFYEDLARQSTRWWQDAKKFITTDRPEFHVQDVLQTYLIGSLRGVARVKSELRIGNGRADITIWPKAKRNPADESAVLELKTIRECHTPKSADAKPIPISRAESVTWACEGIQQTAAYRQTEGMDSAFLCVYDFRAASDATIDSEIAPKAATYNVLSRRYWITSSHTAHREDRFPL